jgi:hypothetical protein
VSADEARERLQANRLAPARVDVPDDDFDEVAAGMQPPMPDEPHLRYRPHQDLDTWIDETIAPIVMEEPR